MQLEVCTYIIIIIIIIIVITVTLFIVVITSIWELQIICSVLRIA